MRFFFCGASSVSSSSSVAWSVTIAELLDAIVSYNEAEARSVSHSPAADHILSNLSQDPLQNCKMKQNTLKRDALKLGHKNLEHKCEEPSEATQTLWPLGLMATASTLPAWPLQACTQSKLLVCWFHTHINKLSSCDPVMNFFLGSSSTDTCKWKSQKHQVSWGSASHFRAATHHSLPKLHIWLGHCVQGWWSTDPLQCSKL